MVLPREAPGKKPTGKIRAQPTKRRATSFADQRVTVDEAAEVVGISNARIKQLISQGWIAKPDGGYTIGVIVKGYLAFLEDGRQRLLHKSGTTKRQTEQSRYIAIKADKEARKLIPTELSVAFVQMVVGEAMSRIQGVPTRYTRDLDERRKLEDIISAVRQEVAEVVEKSIQDLQSGLEFDQADEEDDA